MLEPPYNLKNNIIVSRSYLSNGEQVLDGIHWYDVVFENVHIVYSGGPVELQNVRFINCTFDIKNDTRNNDKLLLYAALNRKSTIIS